MMGHSDNISTSYLERPKGLFEMEYLKIEPLLTVFGLNRSEVNEMSQTVQKLKEDIVQMTDAQLGEMTRVKELEGFVRTLRSKVTNLEEQLNGATQIIETLSPILDTFIEFADTPEFQEFKRKRWEQKELKEIKEADKDFKELEGEVLKGHPIPKKVKSE